jgi:gluconolactonase
MWKSVVVGLVCATFVPAQLPLFETDAQPVGYGDVGATEGPVWHPEKGLYFSGGGGTAIRTLSEEILAVELPGGGTNGLLIDSQMRLVACQPGAKRVIRIESDGSLTILADNYRGAKFNSPNDLAVDSQGRIYFTDPRYGFRDGMELKDSGDRLVEGVYRIDAPGEVSRVITHAVDRPNGILVSPGDEFLYVADNNNDTAGGARKLWRFDLRADGSVDTRTKTLIFDWGDSRGPDGLEMDRAGTLWVAAGRNAPSPPHETINFPAGVYVFSPGGDLLALVPIPKDETTNVAFGGNDLRTLFITAGGTLLSIRVTQPGITPYAPR